MFKDWDIWDAWGALGISLAIFAAILGAVVFFAPKNVDYYYLSTENSGNKAIGFCAYAHWTWHQDEIAYCSDDKDKVLDFVARANATLPHK